MKVGLVVLLEHYSKSVHLFMATKTAARAGSHDSLTHSGSTGGRYC
jgi:hypothetical protein